MIITFLSYKGGVSKTTTALHIAALLNEHAPAVLIDADANRSALAWAHRGALPFRVADEGEAARVARQFEHIIVDTAARPAGAKLKGCVDGSDKLVLVVAPDALSLDAALPAISDLKALGAQFSILLAMVRPNTGEGDAARVALERLGVPVLASMIRQYVAARKAALEGVLVCDVTDARAAELWADYTALCEELRQ